MWIALIYAVGLRPGRMINDGAASPHVIAYHNLSRLTGVEVSVDT
jgi:hypothetical protein